MPKRLVLLHGDIFFLLKAHSKQAPPSRVFLLHDRNVSQQPQLLFLFASYQRYGILSINGYYKIFVHFGNSSASNLQSSIV